MHTGRWCTNHRVGAFDVVDPSGKLWADTYDSFGKRTARKREAELQATLESTDGPSFPAAACKHCGVRFHLRYNYKCRRSTELDAPGCRADAKHEPQD